MSDVPGPHAEDPQTERKKDQSLGFLLVSALGTVLAALWLFLSGGDPGWLVPISFVGGVFILAGASNFAFLSLAQKLQSRVFGGSQSIWLGVLILVVVYLLLTMGPGPNASAS